MRPLLVLLLLAGVSVAAAAQTLDIAVPPGTEKSAATRALEAGAALIQVDAPAEQLDIYLVGFHPLKDDPSYQMEAHHFCRQVNEDFAQCVLFDGNSKESNLNGIEYIISEKLYRGLPEHEKQYWHPHNYEILSGQLAAPGVPDAVEKQLMKGKMNSYGKTWHVWNTGAFGESADRLPLGEPHLAWSFNRDGEARADLVERRDRTLRIDTASKREGRRDLLQLAKPQGGVDAMAGRFPGPAKPLPGVSEEASGAR